MMMKRLFSVFLAVLLVCGLCCSIPAAALAETTETFYTRTADPSTMDSWKDLFGESVNRTTNVGTVWTDKTVTTGVSKDDVGSYSQFQMQDPDSNFMVTLSAISATKSITGHETLPTDTVFVLDLSSSMYRNINGKLYSTSIVGPMVDAVNHAIHTLLTLNPLNRVGVVVYYGGPVLNPQSTANHYTSLLSLGNFAELGSKDYLEIQTADVAYSGGSEKDALVGIQVNAALKTRAGASATSTPYQMPGYETSGTSDSNIAGTYMQLGIEAARDMFLAADTTIPEGSDFQAGATRIPIIVLMSDGEPTAADNSFASVGNAMMGNNSVGERSPAETDFLTQLTAGLTRKLVDEHYVDTTPLFYTLGLETNSISYDVMDPHNTDLEHQGSSAADYTHRTGRAHEDYPANADPKPSNTDDAYQNTAAQVNAKINEYWEQILDGSTVTLNYLQSTDTYGGWDNKSNQSTTVSRNITVDSKSITFPTSIDQKYYVDKYFAAKDANALDDAFSSIVQEIHIQSAYYPTYVENGAIGLSGYLDFHDEIGDMLEVKAVHGLARRENTDEMNYYQGQGLAKYVDDCLDAGGDQLLGLKSVLGKLIQTRFKLSENAALTAAEEIIDPDNKMIYYDETTGAFSNSIFWYANADEQYLGLDLGTRNVPDGAVYAMQSYWYAATSSLEDTENYNSIIRVKTELSTGKQCVTWSVPASMIPLVRYSVTLQNSSLDDPGSISIANKAEGAAGLVNPLRAVFEVGLRSEINKYNAVEYLQAAGYEPDENGVYTFYTNTWTPWETDKQPDPDISQVHETRNTVSYFRPSDQNERYNITEDTPLYVKDGDTYSLYKGDTTPSSSSEYFVAIPSFTKDENKEWGAEANASMTLTHPQLTSGFDSVKKVGGQWYVSNGTATYPAASSINKTTNLTDTVPYSSYETKRDENYVISILGNNGTFSFTADTGMAITKTADALPDGTNPEFTFVIKPTGDGTLSGEYDVAILDTAADKELSAAKVTASDNTLTVKIQSGETAYVAGLPAGPYIVEEQVIDVAGSHRYVVSEVKINGTAVSAPSATTEVPVTQYQMAKVDYTNTLVTTGSITIEKEVESGIEGVTPPSNQTFTYNVELGSQHANAEFTLTTPDGATTQTADASGKLTVSVTAGKPVTISGIAADTSVTVTETDIPAGYTVQGENAQAQTVPANGTATFRYTNVYTPKAASVTFSGVKTLDGRNLVEGEFTFELYQADSNFTLADGAAPLQTATNAAGGKFAFAAIPYNTAGDYYYVVKEVQGSLAAMTYDPTEYHIHIAVTDVDAQLVATVANGTDIGALNFHNNHDETDAVLAFSGVKTLEGRPLTKDEFSFTLYEADAEYNAGRALHTVSNGADGKFAFKDIVYDEVGTYYYVVREIPGNRHYIIHDAAEYQIRVSVWNNNGVLAAECTAYRVVRGERTPVDALTGGLAFTNYYVPSSVTIPLSGTKVYEGGTLAAGMFTFHLYAADAQFNRVGEPLESVANAIDGSFAFTSRTFNKEGMHRFVVVEDASAPLANVIYDPTVYHITITVTDSSSGYLSAAASIATSDGFTADQLMFENFCYEVPATGDSSGLEAYLALCLASLVGLLGLVLTLRRSLRRNNV